MAGVKRGQVGCGRGIGGTGAGSRGQGPGVGDPARRLTNQSPRSSITSVASPIYHRAGFCRPTAASVTPIGPPAACARGLSPRPQAGREVYLKGGEASGLSHPDRRLYIERALVSEFLLADRGSSLCRLCLAGRRSRGLRPRKGPCVSNPSLAPAVATGTTADRNTAPFQQRIGIALALAELERSLIRLELRFLPRSTDSHTERRRRQLQAAAVYASDDLLSR